MKNVSTGKEHVEIVRHHKKPKSSNYREGKMKEKNLRLLQKSKTSQNTTSQNTTSQNPENNQSWGPASSDPSTMHSLHLRLREIIEQGTE